MRTKNSIEVADVVRYYGKWLKDNAEEIIEETKRKTPGWSKLSFSSKMREVRSLLVYEYGKEIPFVTGYERSKDE